MVDFEKKEQTFYTEEILLQINKRSLRDNGNYEVGYIWNAIL